MEVEELGETALSCKLGRREFSEDRMVRIVQSSREVNKKRNLKNLAVETLATFASVGGGAHCNGLMCKCRW